MMASLDITCIARITDCAPQAEIWIFDIHRQNEHSRCDVGFSINHSPAIILTLYRYADLLEFVRAPQNGFMSATLPFSHGFEVMVYRPESIIT